MKRSKPTRDCARLPTVRRFRTLELSDPEVNVEALLSDAMLLGIWEFLRRSARPLSLAEIAERSRLDPSLVQRKLDLLLAYAMIEMQPARGKRRSTCYRSLFDGLAVRFRMPDHLQAVLRHQKKLRGHATHPMKAAVPPPESRSDLQRHADFAGLVHLTEPELIELRRRLDGVAEFVGMLGERSAAHGETPSLCEYGVTLRLQPLARPSLPQPSVRFLPTNGVPTTTEHADTGRKPLSSRERQVAFALARGLTRAEVATELGIAQSTAATLTKRIYVKLRVHRRAELVSRLREEFGNGVSR